MKSGSTSMNTLAAAAPPDPLTGFRVGGFQPFTTLDFPGRMAAVVFLQGCPLRCVYCHNRDLIPARGQNPMVWSDIAKRLARRQSLLQGVVFSGGEPLVQSRLAEALQQVGAMGFDTGLHTSGVLPDRLARLEGLVDWVGFDVKAPFDRYRAVTGVTGSGDRARVSLDLLAGWNIPFEVRVTVWPQLIDPCAVRDIAEAAAIRGCRDFVLQECRDPQSGQGLGGAVFVDDRLLEDLRDMFDRFETRTVH
jgi:pyruvate formate lyase activating enzyme